MNRRPCAGVVVGLAIGACISVPTFKGGDGGVDGSGDGSSCVPDFSGNNPASVGFITDNGGGQVNGGSSLYSIHFGSGNRFRFPDDMRVAGTDVMEERAMTCAEEDLAGMAMFPAAAVRPNGSGMVGTNDLVPEPGWIGPAVVKLLVRWSTQYNCMGTIEMPGGDSLFTLFPDGRIVRHDYMYTTASVDWNDCDCNGGTGFYPTSYWTFERGQFTSIEMASSGSTNIPMFMGSNNDTAACLQAPSSQVSVATAWRRTPSEGTRVRVVSADTIAYVFDFINDHPNTSRPASMFETTTALFVGHGCLADLARAADFVGNGTDLLINQVSRRPAAVDGIYGGVEARGGTGGFPVQGTTATIEGTVRPGFAVWLRFPTATCDITITKNPPNTSFYIKQQIDDDEWVIWFRDELETGHTITVTSR